MKYPIAIFLFISLSIVFLKNNTYAKDLKDYPPYLQSELQLLNCQSLKEEYFNIQNFYNYDYEEDYTSSISYILNKSAFESNRLYRKILTKNTVLDYQIFFPNNKKNRNQNTWALFYNFELPNHSSIQGPTNHFQFQPKELGTHQLFLIQKTPTNECLVSPISSFFVTHNPNYENITTKKFQNSFTCYQTTPSKEKNLHCDELPSLDELYHLQQIDAPKAWEISTGKGVTVALIDSGVNYLHPYLREQLITPTNSPNSGPYDFEFSDPFAFDEYGHGSQMAGFISSAFGVAPDSKTLTFKIDSSNINTIVQAFKASIKNKVNIINLSLLYSKQNVIMSDSFKKELILTLDQLLANDILVIQSAGNKNQDLDRPEYQHFFSQFNYPNWVKVAAYDENFNLASYSNYSNRRVDVMAPGGSLKKPLLSTFVNNEQGVLLTSSKGTSLAAAITSGVAALIRSQKPHLSAIEVKSILLKAGTFSEEKSIEVKSGRILNAWEALNIK